MAAKSAGDEYGSSGSVPNPVPVSGSGAGPMGVKASPDDFGAQVGGAVKEFGDEGEKLSLHYAQMATEAKANDVISNQFAPAASKLRADFYSKQGIDAFNAHDGYVASLQDLRNQYVNDPNRSPVEKQILSGWMSRHVAQEVDGATLHADQQLTKYEDQTHTAMLATNSNNAVANYNNPQTVSSSQDANDGLIQKHGMDRGESQETIDQQKRMAWGGTVRDMVGVAVARGDVTTAASIYGENRNFISGAEQLQIDKMLHGETMKQTGQNNLDAIMGGHPLPYGVIGGDVAHNARVSVASSAQTSGIDPNDALTVLRIESADGTNLGKRGDIGQTGKGGTLQEQAFHLVSQLKDAAPLASKALGRPSEPWENYAVYQQGSGGGPALLKAAQANPTTRAVDALLGVYGGDHKVALSAVQNNGGDANMTAAQFLGHIKELYTAKKTSAMCEIPSTPEEPVPTAVGEDTTAPQQPATLADALNAPHTEQGIPNQPGATPMQTLKNLEENSAYQLSRIEAIPNLDERKATFEAYKEHRTMVSMEAEDWKKTYENKVTTLDNDPHFTSTDQIPADIRAGFTDVPGAQGHLRAKAEYNLKNASGIVDADNQKFGSNFYDLLQNVYKPNGINNVSDLYDYTGDGKSLTMDGYKVLANEIKQRNTPTGQAIGEAKSRMFAMGAKAIYGEAQSYGMQDIQGEELHHKWLAVAMNDYNTGISAGKTPTQLLNPESSDYVGKSIALFARTPEQILHQKLRPTPESLDNLESDVEYGKATMEQVRPTAYATIKQMATNGQFSNLQEQTNAMKRFGLLSNSVPRAE